MRTLDEAFGLGDSRTPLSVNRHVSCTNTGFDRKVPMIHQMPTAARTHMFNDGIRTVTSATFDSQVLEAEGPVVAEFMTYGCSHCGVLEPVLREVAEMAKSKVRICRINIAVEHELADTFQVRVTPTLVMFLNGREVGRIEGPHPSVSSVLTAVTQPFRGMR